MPLVERCVNVPVSNVDKVTESATRKRKRTTTQEEHIADEQVEEVAAGIDMISSFNSVVIASALNRLKILISQ